LGNLKERDLLEDLGLEESIFLKWILVKWNGRERIIGSGCSRVVSEEDNMA
jgi:hypothetical protein